MRKREHNDCISVHAISGTHVVLLGLNATPKARKGLLGFVIKRIDHTENERYWLKGSYPFKETESEPNSKFPKGYPLQTFMWQDFTAKTAHDYTYRIEPVYGKPTALEYGSPVEVKISTEDERVGVHAIYFNRGAAAAKAYARKFKNLPPDEVPDGAAYKWLSRGLEEGLLGFIGQANDSSWGLRAACYEFNYAPVLDAFGVASKSGADVKIIFDNKNNREKSPGQENREAIEEAGIKHITIERATNPSYISHNKFIVLLKDGKPIEVWTGSTNITEGGIFGQSNVGHIVRDSDIARAYFDYWLQLQKDPQAKNLRKWTDAYSAVPGTDVESPYLIPIFSPSRSLEALEWYTK